MLNVVKYIDGDALVVIYNNFKQMEVSEKVEIMRNLNDAEMMAAAGVEPDNSTVEIKTLKEFTNQLALPEAERDQVAIKKYLHNSIQELNVDDVSTWSKGQVTSFVKIYQPFLPKHVWTLIKKADTDGYEMAKDLILCLKGIV